MNTRTMLRDVACYFARKKEIHCVYLFGSFAAGNAKADSDLDLGVVLRETVAQSRYTGLRLDYSVSVEKISRKTPDILILNGADTF